MGDFGLFIFSSTIPRARSSNKLAFPRVLLGPGFRLNRLSQIVKFSQVLDNWYMQVMNLQISDIFNIFENNKFFVIFLKKCKNFR